MDKSCENFRSFFKVFLNYYRCPWGTQGPPPKKFPVDFSAGNGGGFLQGKKVGDFFSDFHQKGQNQKRRDNVQDIHGRFPF